MSLNTRKQRTVDSAPPNTPTSIDLQAWMYRGIFSYLFRIFPQSRQWAQPKQDPVDRKASRASSSSRLQSLETRLLFFSLKLDWQPPMHEVYLRSTMEHAQTSCGMWSNPIGPSTRTRVQINHAPFSWGGGAHSESIAIAMYIYVSYQAPSRPRPIPRLDPPPKREGGPMEETRVGLVCGAGKGVSETTRGGARRARDVGAIFN